MTSPQRKAWKELYKKASFQVAALAVARELQQQTSVPPDVALTKVFHQASADAENLLNLDEANLKEWLMSYYF